MQTRHLFHQAFLNAGARGGAGKSAPAKAAAPAKPAKPAEPLPRIDSDLNGDGRSDIVMLNQNGSCGAWLVQPDQSAKWIDIGVLKTAPRWSFIGCARLAGKHRGDIVLQSKRDNLVGAWTVEKGKVTGWKDLGSFGRDVTIVGIGDFNGDGIDDLLLRNNKGVVWAYLTTDRTNIFLGNLAPRQFIAGIGDFNGDGIDDVLIRADGFAGCWIIDADRKCQWFGFDSLPNDRNILGVGDFNGDGTDDVLIEHGGYLGAWTIKHGALPGWMGMGELPANNKLEAIGDFDGDGFDDLRIRTADGVIGALLVKGADRLVWQEYGCLGKEWDSKPAGL